jgi:periplasmic mercuric ion binding protein
MAMSKMKAWLLVVCMVGFVAGASAQSDSAKAKAPSKQQLSLPVAGNCGQCKARIETALDVPGISRAAWSAETKMLQVTYKPQRISEAEIAKLVATAGHDTPKAKASLSAYNKLPDCCRYREPSSTKSH